MHNYTTKHATTLGMSLSYINHKIPSLQNLSIFILQLFCFCLKNFPTYEFYNGPWGPWACETSKFPHFLDNRLTDGGESYAPTALYSPGGFLVLISVRDWVDPRAVVRLEGLTQMKNPMPLSGIELGRFSRSNSLDLYSPLTMRGYIS
jgi:hypothetical protein